MANFFSKVINGMVSREGFIPLLIRPARCARRQPSRGGLSVTGFTLIELLVVLAITSMLSSALLLYNHTTREQVALYTEEAKFVQVLYRAKSLSLSTFRQPSSSKSCGYGVHIDYGSMTYALFRYAQPSGGVPCRAISSIDRANSEETLFSYALGRDVVFLASPPNAGARFDDILFVPPDPVTLIFNFPGTLVQGGFGNVVLATEDGSAQTTVTVNSGGQVTF